jgi:sigma-B regulation protein RsbU (phosphoserine phosphatase)
METQAFKNSTVLEPKQFHRRLEAIFEQLNTSGRREWLSQLFLSGFQHYLAEDLHVCAIHIYETTTDNPNLLLSWGKSFGTVQTLLTGRVADEAYPWFLRWNKTFISILPFGEEADLLFVFFLDETVGESIYSTVLTSYFSTLQYALVQHFRRLKLQDAMEEAREIQLSLLPSESPRLAGFDIAARTIPARIVGGDVYDFFQASPDLLMILIADAAGHGLPAALQARDVITGFRMGCEQETSLNHVLEKLNRVIHKSGLVSRFISIVAGQLGADGVLRYINAGHPSPILMRGDRSEKLQTGGMILGPHFHQSYTTGNIHMQSGDSLVLYSDGILEHASPEGIEFGLEGIMGWMKSSQGPSERCIDDLFTRLELHGNRKSFQDDASVLLIKRL